MENRRSAGATIPRAVVAGEPFALPEDLYIPPDALEIILRSFEGPMDLLLYLIRRKNLDILELPVAEITAQYVHYIDLMKELKLDLAAEYLLMAAMLTEIKSRLLLPRQALDEEGEEVDPRAELVRRLQEYERFQQAALDLDALPQVGRDVFPMQVIVSAFKQVRAQPQVTVEEILAAYQSVMARAALCADHEIKREQLSVRARMSSLLSQLEDGARREFRSLFPVAEGPAGVVVTLLAILELLKSGLIDMLQNAPLAPLYVSRKAGVMQ